MKPKTFAIITASFERKYDIRRREKWKEKKAEKAQETVGALRTLIFIRKKKLHSLRLVHCDITLLEVIHL